jgi:hypothetical protein
MAKEEKPASDNKSDKPSRTDQAREVVEEYAADLRETINRLSKSKTLN